MAILEVKVPQLSESVAEATLLHWHKRVGEPVSRDENMIDIETDKVVLELPAPADGIITQLMQPDGATVVAGQIIALIDTDGSAKVSPMEVSSLPVPQPHPESAPAAAAPADPVAAAISSLGSKAAANVAMPAAAKMLAENNMTTAQVDGTGKDGRVTKGDVINQLHLHLHRHRLLHQLLPLLPNQRCSKLPPAPDLTSASALNSACR
jgi:2-oxoglutarate dehydrogenase E2 component (dihydrolipoamide succinyltransferase)